MITPVRIMLSRKRGFRLQDHSRAINGLDAVNVARPTKWGNPWKAGRDGSRFHCVTAFRLWSQHPARKISGWDKSLEELRGKNLACWCNDGPCHADVLLDLANK